MKTNPNNSQPARKRRLWKLLTLPAMLAVLVWLMPSIVANTPLMSWGIKLATAKLNGSITVGSASLGWFSPLSVQNVEVRDAQGKPMLSLQAADVNRSLAALLWNYADLGRIRLVNPKMTLVLRENGSNVEDLLAKYLATTKETESKSSSSKIGLSLEMVEGSLTVTEQRTGQSWQVEKMTAGIEMPQGVDGPVTAHVSADLPDVRHPGKFSAEAKIASGAGEVKLNTTGLSLGMFRALAERFSPGTTCDGRLSSNLVASWGGMADKNSIQADLRAEGFSFTTAALQTDVVQLEQLSAVCRASWKADDMEIERSSVDCDVGNIVLASTMKLGGLSFESLLHQRHELSGRVDVARLARLLPATLRLRQQVDIKSGQVQVALSSRPEPSGMVWHGQVNADNITATASGRQIAWQRPMSLVADVRETPEGPAIDNLQCESDFLKMHAHGSPDNLVASLSFSLQQLSDQLGQFVDFGSFQLAGEGWGNLNWQRSAEKQFNTDAEIRLKNFQLGLPNQPAWQEADLVALFSAKGQTDLGSQTRIDSATLNVKSGDDQIEARLTQPIQNPQDGGAWPLRIQAQGQLQNWPGRLAAWLPTKDCHLTGNYTLGIDGIVSKDQAELRQATLTASPLIVATPWLNMNEPKFDVTLTGSWNQTQRRLQIEPGSLNCATVAVQANNVLLAVPENGELELSGTLKYQGDAARLRQWFTDPVKPPTWGLAGQLNGTAQVRQSAGVIRGETTTDLTNLAVVDASGQQFQEPRVRLVASGDYNRQTSVIQLEKMELTSSVVAAGVAGRIAPVSGANNAEINGQVSYDMERLAGLLRPYIGPGVQIVGRGTSPAGYRGPFSLAAGSANAGLQWDWANVYGLQVGPGKLKASMANGLLQIEPLNLAVSRGQMHLAPTVRMTPDPIELTLPRGPLAQQIQIDPVICSTMVKYIAPALAEVATARGTFSVDLEGCRIPLGNLAQGELAGRFTIHTMEVGPGPLIRTFAVFLGRESPANLRQESVIQFRMVGGRVYHQGLELIFPDLTIRTYGSVGLDQTMAIMAEMPVPPKWIQQNPVAAQALQGQMIRIPIGGTLSKPQLDQKVMQDLTRQFMQRAAENMIQGEMNKQLDRLFGPRK